MMCVTYFHIYKAAVAHTKSLRLGAKQLTTNGSEGHGGQEVVLRMHRGGGTSSASAAGTPNGHSRLEIGRVYPKFGYNYGLSGSIWDCGCAFRHADGSGIVT